MHSCNHRPSCQGFLAVVCERLIGRASLSRVRRLAIQAADIQCLYMNYPWVAHSVAQTLHSQQVSSWTLVWSSGATSYQHAMHFVYWLIETMVRKCSAAWDTRRYTTVLDTWGQQIAASSWLRQLLDPRFLEQLERFAPNSQLNVSVLLLVGNCIEV